MAGTLLSPGKPAFSAATPVGTSAVARLGTLTRHLTNLVPQLMRDNRVPGASMAVVKDGRAVWHRGFGIRDTRSRAPVDDHTVFEAASVSKTVFAYAVMQLCDRGVLALDTPLVKYAPGRIVQGDPRSDLITARHLLSHTSGLPNLRSSAEPLAIEFTPGQRYKYSGEGYWYLQSVVTRLTGKTGGACSSYESDLEVCGTDIGQYLEENVLGPCGMGSSGYTWRDRLEKHMARPHDAHGEPLPLAKPGTTDAARYAAMGGLLTTAMDYVRFLLAVIAPPTSARLRLSTALRQEMLRPHVKVEATRSWALGWEVLHGPRGDLIQHQGGQRGVQAFAAASVDRRAGYVILTNGDNGWKVFYDERFKSLLNEQLFSAT